MVVWRNVWTITSTLSLRYFFLLKFVVLFLHFLNIVTMLFDTLFARDITNARLDWKYSGTSAKCEMRSRRLRNSDSERNIAPKVNSINFMFERSNSRFSHSPLLIQSVHFAFRDAWVDCFSAGFSEYPLCVGCFSTEWHSFSSDKILIKNTLCTNAMYDR